MSLTHGFLGGICIKQDVFFQKKKYVAKKKQLALMIFFKVVKTIILFQGFMKPKSFHILITKEEN